MEGKLYIQKLKATIQQNLLELKDINSIMDENEVTYYNLYTSPIRNVIFNPGKTSRINVADFMKLLLIDKDLWDNFKIQMPVIYNK